MKNKPINTKATGDYNKGYTGAPAGSGRGSIEPKGKRSNEYYTQTIYEPTYLKQYNPEELTGAYAKQNQNKSL